MENLLWWLPPVPVSAIDAFNRAALATGCVDSAMKGAYADYNGHRYEMSFNDHRHAWICGYMWSGWNVIARGTFEDCLRTAVRAVGAKGSSLEVKLANPPTPSAEAPLRASGLVPKGPDALDAYEATLPWQARSEARGTTRVGYAFLAVREWRVDGVPADLFFNAGSYSAWQEAVAVFKAARRRPVTHAEEARRE
jgi:hypothetical protein